jgi:tetratricopeptide (TPR) repeat protein
MNTPEDDPFAMVLEARQARLKLKTSGEAMATASRRPSFTQAAQARADRLGLSVDEMLAQDLRRIEESKYPGPECLLASEVETYAASGELPPDRVAHVGLCPGCEALLKAAASRPGSSLLEHEAPVLDWPASRSRKRATQWLATHSWIESLAVAAASLFVALGISMWLSRGSSPSLTIPVAVLGPPSSETDVTESWPTVLCSQVVGSMLKTSGGAQVVAWDDVAKFAFDFATTNLNRLSPGQMQRIRRAFGSGSVIHCGGEAGGEQDNRDLQVIVQIMDSKGAIKEASFASRSGRSERLVDLAFNAGRWAREQFGFPNLPANSKGAVRAVSPTNTEAARFYAMGLADLADFRPAKATTSLSRAVDLEPHPLVYSALSRAWAILGDSRRERSAAEAASLLANKYQLSKTERLTLDGRLLEAQADWHQAIKVYSRLESDTAHGQEYGIQVAEACLKTADALAALAKVQELRKTPLAEGNAARLDLLEARAAEILGDFNRQLEAALRASAKGRILGARALEAEGSLVAGRAACELGDWVQAGEFFQEAKRQYSEIGDLNGSAGALREEGVLYARAEKLEAAQATLEHARKDYQSLHNTWGEATVESDLGNVLDARGQGEEAMHRYASAVSLFEQIGNPRGKARALTGQAIVLWELRKWPAALKNYDEALSIFGKISDRAGQANVLGNRGLLVFEQGHLREAREDLERTLAISRELGQRPREAWAHTMLAEVLTYLGDLATAEKHYSAALDLYKELGEPFRSAQTQVQRAQLWNEQGRAADAEGLVRAQLQLLHKAGAEAPAGAEASASAVLAQSLLLQHQPQQAREAVAFSEVHTRDPRLRYELDILSAQIDAESGQPARGIEALRRLTTRVKAEGAPLVFLRLEAQLALAQAQLSFGDRTTGKALLDEVAKEANAIGAKLIAEKAKHTTVGGMHMSSLEWLDPTWRAGLSLSSQRPASQEYANVAQPLPTAAYPRLTRSQAIH